MSLLFCDSFDYYSTGDMLRKYDGGAATISAAVGRRGTAAARFPDLRKNVIAGDVFIVGFAHWNDATSGGLSTSRLVHFYDGTTIQVQVNLTSQGQIQVYRGSGTSNLLAETANAVLLPDTFQYIEVMVTIANAGNVTVRLDETEIINVNGDTQSTANATIDEIRIGAGSNIVDDLYILDDAGAAPRNTFLGDIQVDHLHPDGNGNYSDFSTLFPVGGNPFEKVDEADTDDDTTYIETNTAAHRESFTLEDLAALTGGDTVFGVQINTVMDKEDSGAQTAQAFLRISGSDFDGSAVNLTESYINFREVHGVNPNGGGEWTSAIINGIEAGIEHI